MPQHKQLVRMVALALAMGLAGAIASCAREPQPVAAAEYPPHNTNRLYAEKNLQGQPGPEIVVERWITDQPSTEGKVLVIDFWATWCPPCRDSIPHANELAEMFPDDVAIIGISNEKPDDFAAGMEEYNLALENFEYSLALDPEGRAARFVGVQGIPHVIVMSSDGIVRWQGMPQNLTADTLRAIVQANNQQRAG